MSGSDVPFFVPSGLVPRIVEVGTARPAAGESRELIRYERLRESGYESAFRFRHFLRLFRMCVCVLGCLYADTPGAGSAARASLAFGYFAAAISSLPLLLTEPDMMTS